MMRFHRGLDIDTSQAHLDRANSLRAWKYLRPYRMMLLASLGVITMASIVSVAPAFVFKRLIDHSTPARDLGSVDRLAAAAVGLALFTTTLSLVNRWFGARIGEGLIYDLRSDLYRHVQAMPLAFFTRTQTGSLLSRLSSDVVGAQATVGTAASVTSDLMTLASTLIAMVALSWQVTALALLVLPGFFVLDRQLGPRLKELTRKRMRLNASMTS